MAETKKTYENKVTVVGRVKDFEVKGGTAKTSGIPYLSVNWTIETGDGEVHNLQQMAMEYFVKNGQKEENKGYKAIETLQSKIVSMKDIADGIQEGTASVVRAVGGMEANLYKNKNTGELQEATRLTARFVSELKDYSEADFGATFTLKTFLVTAPVAKVADGEETDEAQFKAAGIDYKGQAHPFNFEANNEYGVAEWLIDNGELGMTATIGGVIENKYKVIEVERPNPAGVGKPVVDTKREVLRRMLVESVIPVEDEDSIDFITADERKKALELFEAKKVEVLSAKTEAPKGVQTAATSKPKTTTPSSVVNADDLPF